VLAMSDGASEDGSAPLVRQAGGKQAERGRWMWWRLESASGPTARGLRLKQGDYVMVARKTRTATKMEARRTGTHQVLQCHSAHRYTIKDLVTNEETVEHASYLEYDDEHASYLQYYYDEIASTNELKTQVAHDTFAFKVSGIGGLEQREKRWPGRTSMTSSRASPFWSSATIRKQLRSKTLQLDGTDINRAVSHRPLPAPGLHARSRSAAAAAAVSL
jgi:hypothetical protein